MPPGRARGANVRNQGDHRRVQCSLRREPLLRRGCSSGLLSFAGSGTPRGYAPVLSGARLIASFDAVGSECGLGSTNMLPGRYLIVASVLSATASPIAYAMDLPAERFVSGSTPGLDFAFADSR